jgi:hypothetical protein
MVEDQDFADLEQLGFSYGQECLYHLGREVRAGPG